jgi:hypothetical protein
MPDTFHSGDMIMGAATVAVTDYYKCGERETTSTLHNLCNAVDVNNT